MRTGKRGMRAAAFTMIELLIVIAITGVLAAMLMPGLVRARERARATACMSNFRQVGLAFELFLIAEDHIYPSNPLWKEKLWAHVAPEVEQQISRCPSRPDLPWHMGQGYNVGYGPQPGSHAVPGFEGRPAGQITHPGSKILIAEWGRNSDGEGGCNSGPPYKDSDEAELAESGIWRFDSGGPPYWVHDNDGNGPTSYWAVERVHLGAGNLLFGDGSVRMREPEAFHSNADGTGIAQGLDGADLEISDRWRRYWDTSYGGN